MTQNNDINNILETKLLLDSLCIYRNLLRDPVISRHYSLVEHVSNSSEISDFLRLYTEFYNSLTLISHNADFWGYIIEKIVFDENSFSVSNSETLEAAVINDLRALQKAAALSSNNIKNVYIGNSRADGLYEAAINRLPSWNTSSIKAGKHPDTCTKSSAAIVETLNSADDWGECLEALKAFYETYGCGDFARCKAFIWHRSGNEGKLVPVQNPDPIRLTDLIDYESERWEVVKNTEHFLNGHPANNVLLYGDRGTGKSSTVKAILNEYHSRGLRVIEVPKNLLVDFPEIVSGLSHRKQRFILFCG